MSLLPSIAMLPRRSLAYRLGMLCGVMGAAYGGVVLVATCKSATHGVPAASLAVGICLASASAALLISHALHTSTYSVSGALLPLVARTGVPLFLALIVRVRGQALVEAGFVYYLMGFYLLALVTEIPMSLPVIDRAKRQSEVAHKEDFDLHG